MGKDPWAGRLAVAAIENLLCAAPSPGGRAVVREPSLIRVSGGEATARHYVLEYDLARARLIDLRYGLWRFHRADDRWSIVDVAEVSAGDGRVLEFLADGLDRDFAAVRVPPGDTGETDDSELQRATDADAIRAMLAAYGLAADAGDADLVGALYTPDAVVDIGGDQIYAGREPMMDMIAGRFHRSLLPWAGHTMGPSLVSVDADRAVSLHIGRTYGPPPRSVTDLSAWNRHPFRYSVNRWTLVRGDPEWQVAERISRPVPGTEWRALLADGVRAWRENSVSGGERSDYLDTRRALDVVTAAAFTLSAGGVIGGWPFTGDAHLDIDGRRVRAAAMTAGLDLPHPCVGLLPTSGSARVDGNSATVSDLLMTYVDDDSGRIGPVRTDFCRWDLLREGDSWAVRGATLHDGSVPQSGRQLV